MEKVIEWELLDTEKVIEGYTTSIAHLLEKGYEMVGYKYPFFIFRRERIKTY